MNSSSNSSRNTAVTDPFWGPQTSYLNFCEEDYVVTRYIAEFVNTFSSLIFLYFGLYGLLSYPRFPTGSRLVLYCGLMGVGVCSAGYHMTLKYHTQMSDELSMHLLTTPLLHRLLTYKATPRRATVVSLVLSTLFVAVMVTHIVLDEFILHAVTFALGVFYIAYRSIQIIPERFPASHTKSTLRTIALTGCTSFAAGYALWLVDDWACQLLISARRSVGLPIAWFLELHGWWHVLTAIGGYIGVVIVDLITSDEVTEDPVQNLAWPVPLVIGVASRFTKQVKRE